MTRSFTLCMIATFLTSCQTFNFYRQAVAGQWEILANRRSNQQVMDDPATSAHLRKKLASVEQIRRFASEHLSLPGDESYAKYSNVGREHLVWVLYAAPEFSLKPKTWFYPGIGKMDYRGYFNPSETNALATQMKSQGYDVFIGEVDAYSTLGWFHDPILNTFVHYPDIDLAETIFHELTHRKVFRKGDTVFNESLANTVAEEGVKRWLKSERRFADFEKYQGRLLRRREFYQKIEKARSDLELLYASGLAEPEMRSKKATILTGLRDEFRELRRRWGGRGLESWLKQDINNGHIVSLHLYADQMPPFQRLLAECNGDLDVFFERVISLKINGQ